MDLCEKYGSSYNFMGTALKQSLHPYIFWRDNRIVWILKTGRHHPVIGCLFMLKGCFYWVFYDEFRSAVNEINVRGQLETLLFILLSSLKYSLRLHENLRRTNKALRRISWEQLWNRVFSQMFFRRDNRIVWIFKPERHHHFMGSLCMLKGFIYWVFCDEFRSAVFK